MKYFLIENNNNIMKVNCLGYWLTTWSLVFLLCVTHIFAFASTYHGKGAYQAHNAKQSLAVVVDEQKETDKFFGSAGANSRAPAHDTPASPCKCSEYT